MTGRGETRGVNDILDRLDELSGSKGKVSLGEIVEHVGSRGYGPFLIVPALVELSPLGAVPGVPTFLAALILLFAMQILFGRRHLWLPRFVARRSVSERKMHSAVRKLRPVAGRMDRWFHKRLAIFTNGLFVPLAAAGAIGLALMVPPLELIPFASSAPMIAIAVFGLALLAHDGVLMILALLLAIGVVAVGASLFFHFR